MKEEYLDRVADMMTKIPRLKMEIRAAFLRAGICVRRNMGIAMQSRIRSEERLKTALVIRWWRAVLHCAFCVGTALEGVRILHNNESCETYQ